MAPPQRTAIPPRTAILPRQTDPSSSGQGQTSTLFIVLGVILGMLTIALLLWCVCCRARRRRSRHRTVSKPNVVTVVRIGGNRSRRSVSTTTTSSGSRTPSTSSASSSATPATPMQGPMLPPPLPLPLPVSMPPAGGLDQSYGATGAEYQYGGGGGVGHTTSVQPPLAGGLGAGDYRYGSGLDGTTAVPPVSGGLEQSYGLPTTGAHGNYHHYGGGADVTTSLPPLTGGLGQTQGLATGDYQYGGADVTRPLPAVTRGLDTSQGLAHTDYRFGGVDATTSVPLPMSDYVTTNGAEARWPGQYKPTAKETKRVAKGSAYDAMQYLEKESCDGLNQVNGTSDLGEISSRSKGGLTHGVGSGQFTTGVPGWAGTGNGARPGSREVERPLGRCAVTSLPSLTADVNGRSSDEHGRRPAGYRLPSYDTASSFSLSKYWNGLGGSTRSTRG